jgi:ferrous iron transport protein B
MVVALNMVDEAERKGIHIDVEKLSHILGVPVVPTIAYIGKGLAELVRTALRIYEKGILSSPPSFSKYVETIIQKATLNVANKAKELNIPPRFLALKVFEKDSEFEESFKADVPSLYQGLKEAQRDLKQRYGRPSDVVISSERHALAMNIYEEVVEIIRSPKHDIRDKIDDVLMHKIWGYVFLALMFYGFFSLVFKVGSFIEEPLMVIFDQTLVKIKDHLHPSFFYIVVEGAIQGIAGGIAIVLPYLIPFLIGLAILEDSGYLPRVAFLLDSFMHRLGLHGKSVIAFILGYGCSVPAVMATRVLKSERDRFITAILATLVPCSARTIIILGLVSYYLGPNYALAIYVLNLLVIGFCGLILTKIFPEVTPGLILEVPNYHVPSFRAVGVKSWYRLKEFIFMAWPLLIVGSIVLGLLEFFHLDKIINTLCLPITMPLGLPEVVGTTLIFGILRKELSLIMLVQALGTHEILTAMTKGQVLTFTIFVVFYIPCVATIAALWREIGGKKSTFAVIFSFLVAFIVAILIRFFSHIFF